MVTLHATQEARRRILYTALLAAAPGMLSAATALAQESSQISVGPDPLGRTRVLLATLALILLCLGLTLLVWYASRLARSLISRDAKRFQPSGKVGPSDWSLPELASIGRQCRGDSSDPTDDEQYPGEDFDDSDDDSTDA